MAVAIWDTAIWDTLTVFGYGPVEALRGRARLLDDLERSASYRGLEVSRARAMRGLNELPDYWLPPLAKLTSDARLERVRTLDDVRRFLSARALSATSLEAFRSALEAIPHRFPEADTADDDA